jgi:hypothetical protein
MISNGTKYAEQHKKAVPLLDVVSKCTQTLQNTDGASMCILHLVFLCVCNSLCSCRTLINQCMT